MLKFHPNTTVENGSNANKQLFPTKKKKKKNKKIRKKKKRKKQKKKQKK